MRLLLISNSTNPGEPYLDYPKNNIREFLGTRPVTALFIPYAAVTFSYEVYEQKVSERFREVGHDIESIHRFIDPAAAIKNAAAIAVGGGNTWKLLKTIRENNLIDANPAGHAGETREQRIEEFIEINPDTYVVGLREGTMLLIETGKMRLIGPRKARIFRKGSLPSELGTGEDLSFLLLHQVPYSSK